MKPPLAVAGLLGLFLLTACTDGGVTGGEELREPASTTARQALDASPSRDAATTRHTATLLADGTVLLAGGRDLPTSGATTEGAPRRKAWLYVSSDVGLTPLPELVTARAGHTATRLWDGSVLLAGGFDAAGNALKSTELFVPGDAAFTSGASMLWARGDGTATLLGDGTVLLVGGYEDEKHERPSPGIELYDPPTQTFRTVPNPRNRSGSNVAVTLADGTVAIYWADAADPKAELFDPRSGRLSLPEPPLFAAVASEGIVAATRLPSGALALLDGAGVHATNLSGQCESGSESCNGQCTALATADNCGSCGNACPADATCTDAGCVCNSGMECDGRCADVMSDTQNCGTCGNACGAGQGCISGRCQNGCGALTECSGECVDVMNDSANCGACEHACASGETCVGGTCQPPSCGYYGSRCGSECVDLATDHEHCGSCPHACANSEACQGGVCRRCDGETLLCGTVCVDLFTDVQNCGQCGKVCNGICGNGVCASCPAGQAMCGGYCTAVDTADNCGDCSRQCAAGYDCVSGECVFQAANAAIPALAGATLWTVESSSATSYSVGALVVGEGGSVSPSGPGPITPNEAFGSSGHTTTALPDGSLLVVGGDDTPRALRVYPTWTGPYASLAIAIQGYTDSPLTALLPDGRLLILAGTAPGQTNAYLYDGQPIGPQVASLPLASPLVAAVQASGKVLLLARGGVAALFDPVAGTATGLELASSLTSQGQGTGIALPGGGLFVAGRAGVDVLSAPGGKTLALRSHSIDLGCDAPSITRLMNGRILVVGNDQLYEVDPKSGDVAVSADLILPRCHASAIQRRDGTVVLVGGLDDASRAQSLTGELYDPVKRTTKRWSLETGSAPPDGKPRYWFDEPLLVGWGTSSGLLLDWQSSGLTDARFGSTPPTSSTPSDTHLTADGSWLTVDNHGGVSFARRSSAEAAVHGTGGAGGSGGTGGVAGKGGAAGAAGMSSAGRASGGAGAPSARIYDAPPLSLHMADSVDFDATFPEYPFPGHAPEGSSGTTQSSPTNLPIPVWFPAEGGWPSLGTLVRSGSKTTYRVPSTPFPGLGLLFLATNGDLTPLGPVTIAPSPNAARCQVGGECESGHCVDGVCCNQACDGTCEACSRAMKGSGKDGECGAVTAGTPDATCRDDITTCGENGTCDGSGHCALYPDGTECGPGATCRTQSGTGRRSCVENAPAEGNGAGGSAGAADPGRGPTAGAPTTPRSTCNADEQVVSPEGTVIFDCKPFRCRNGACVRQCESSRDCALGFACDSSGSCRTPVTQHAKSVGCGCRVPGNGGTSDSGLLSLLAAAASLARRTKRGTRRGASGPHV